MNSAKYPNLDHLELLAYKDFAKALEDYNESLNEAPEEEAAGQPYSPTCRWCNGGGYKRMRKNTGRTRVIKKCPTCDESKSDLIVEDNDE